MMVATLPIRAKAIRLLTLEYTIWLETAEWVSDVYRPLIDDEANDFNYYRGNIYLKMQLAKMEKQRFYLQMN